mmetsp:Transcript_3574/g.8895  ORF Transcript_3574/g.8895 Transcript_3574/m.8895 type:complete len:221 (-) Transcript_3574:463-1125(-)
MGTVLAGALMWGGDAMRHAVATPIVAASTGCACAANSPHGERFTRHPKGQRPLLRVDGLRRCRCRWSVNTAAVEARRAAGDRANEDSLGGFGRKLASHASAARQPQSRRHSVKVQEVHALEHAALDLLLRLLRLLRQLDLRLRHAPQVGRHLRAALVYLAQQHHVLAPHHIQPQRNVPVLVAHDYPLHRVLKHQVGELVEGAQHADDLLPIAQLHEQLLV